MELESEDGAVRIPIASLPKKTEIGRGAGFAFSDRTVSRRHLAFHLDVPSKGTPEGKPLHGIEDATVSFEVIGRNPILVLSREGVKKIFRTSEVGKLGAGDRISPSLKNPFFFFLRCGGGGGDVDRGVMDAVKRREKRTMERTMEKEGAKGSDTGRVSVASFNWEEDEEEGDDVAPEIKCLKTDLSHIDPVKEFGFLVMGHEFDHCRRKICDMKSWNWLLDEQRDGSDDDRRPGRSQKRRGRMNKRGREDDDVDEDWTEESGAEKAVAGLAASERRAKYLTRSKDQKRPKPDESSAEETKQRRGYGGRRKSRVEEEKDDEEDESLGGFIVDNEEEEEGQDEEEEEEEEFDDRDEGEDD